MTDAAKIRCAWPGRDPLYLAYHDLEWGTPERASKALFAKLILDGFQAGLSWITILRKRDAFCAAFSDFDPVRVASFTETDVERLLQDKGIVRSRTKILAAVGNARAYLAMEDRGEDFSDFIWSFVGGRTLHNPWSGGGDAALKAPVSTRESEALSKALRARGFKFCGPVIVYAFMQAVGMVNDHAADCFRYAELGGEKLQ
jgi:DNA-3-methyladenine glycosylase I